jgi:hypothetical protein
MTVPCRTPASAEPLRLCNRYAVKQLSNEIYVRKILLYGRDFVNNFA